MAGYIEWRYAKRLGQDRAILRVRDSSGKHHSLTTDYTRDREAYAEAALEALDIKINGSADLPPARMADQWLESVRPASGGGTGAYHRSKIDQLLALMPESWDGWTQEALDSALEAYRKANSARSGEMLTRTAEGFLSHARRRGLSHLPLRLSRMARKRSERPRASGCTPDEIGRLLRASRESGWLAVPLAYYAGLRRTEIQGLLWSDVGPDHLRIRPAKAAVERLVPIHEDLRPYLVERGEGPVVPGAYRAAGFYKRLRRIYEDAGVEYREGRPLNILRSSFHEAMMGAKEDS